MKSIQEWYGLLEVDKDRSKSSEDFWARCPCHSDTNASLHVYIGRKTGDVVMKCFVCLAGQRDVEKALKEHPEMVHMPDVGQAAKPTQRDLAAVLEEAAQIIINRVADATDGLDDGAEIAIPLCEAVSKKLRKRVVDHYWEKRHKPVSADGFETKETEESK